jgi:N-acetyl-gamma-glutamyl-phosphate reductase common form
VTTRTPTFIVGGTGYVAGELLRLVAGHPGLVLKGVSSASQAGSRIAESFPHLVPALGDRVFIDQRTLAAELDRRGGDRVALLSAAPHVVSAGLLGELIGQAERSGVDLVVVDVSSDFRFHRAADFQAVYKEPHGAPHLLERFTCALPEHVSGIPGTYIGHPGCFATSMLLAMVPLLAAGMAKGPLYATGVTGSTGAGRTPIATTHHPERHSNLFAYNPLKHRHAPEVVGICEALTGVRPALQFIPHSGPFARGIHLTLQTELATAMSADALREHFATFYRGQPFVRIVDGQPRVKNVAGSNYAEIGVATAGNSAAVFVTIDNLIKGASGGAIQWLNRLLGLPETTGLDAPAHGWI